MCVCVCQTLQRCCVFAGSPSTLTPLLELSSPSPWSSTHDSLHVNPACKALQEPCMNLEPSLNCTSFYVSHKKKIPWTYYETYCRIRINFCKISCLKSVKGPFDGSDGTWLIVLNDQWSVWKLRKAELAIILLLLLSRDHNLIISLSQDNKACFLMITD